MSNIISFPGLGIDGFEVNPVAFSIFGYDIMWYGIIITLAMVAGFLVANHNAKFEKIKTDDVLDLAIFLIIFSMVGARLYYVLMKLENFHSFWDVINVRNGGLAIFGGVGAGALTVFVVAKVKKIAPGRMYDMVAPGLMLGQAIGRWGNFMNAEAHGVETKLPWRMGIQYAGSSVTKYYHPTFLYESLWNLVGFAIVMAFYKKKKFNGQHAIFYMIWYGFGRFFIEGLRTDSLYFMKSVFGETIRVSQAVGAIIFVLGVICMTVGLARAKDRALDEADYDRVYSSGHDEIVGKSGKSTDGENYDIKPSSDAENGADSPADAPAEPEKNDESKNTSETDETENNDGKDN